MKIPILILATLVVGALCEEKCVPGTTFMEDCNKCRCSNTGQKACTRKMCPPNELSDDAQVRTEPVPNGESLSSADEKDEVHLQTNGQVCTPNEIKMQECNRCRCANNGIGWFCTRRVCPPREKRAAGTAKCTPGSTFMADDGCNTCHCNEDGRAACTRVMCEPLEGAELLRFRRETPESPAGPKCTPGTTFQAEDGCNTCYCDAQGRAACSLKFCASSDVSAFRSRLQRRQVKETKCTPGSTFMADDGCNTCHCNEDGRAACTRVMCEPLEGAELLRFRRETPESPAGPKCTPGTTFMAEDGCNTCYCDAQGRAACSLKFCASSDVSAFRSRLERRQVNEFPGMQKCTPGTTFRDADDCNTCYCNEDGRAACTRKACIRKDSELYKQLQQTQKSSNDASLTPDTEGQRQRRQVKEINCTPGTTFKSDDGCNNCFCDENGQAACTLMACLPNTGKVQHKRQTSGDLPQSEVAPGTPGFSCTPRSSFKYQCNTCLCSDDGKNAGCTFKFCIPGEW
ncbi:kielin/chordin-like protein [Anopheles ziemanni]|uniref:kielin/chordin-like protein n=1 Tax=Anopheles coustani TaxID=139045 RepID=UPI00265B15D8|nr:kielin/chordin-like protein [Anopheles coustani]XP_058170066.1 kielin/chordin-like protein [Anopheles ziemanni]